MTVAEIAGETGRTVRAIYIVARKLGLRRTKEQIAAVIRTKMLEPGRLEQFRKTQFQRGHVPANKGLRRPGWAPGRMRETQFQPGTRPRNWMPVGSIVPDSDGYLRIKVREWLPGERTGFGNVGVWPMYQRWAWAQAHGEIPAGHVVVFRDGDRRNCALENLELITRADLARRNRMWGRYPDELAKAIQLNGALKRKVRERGEKQAERSA